MIENILNNPLSVEKNGRLAMETARERPWFVYEQELTNVLLKLKL